VALWLSCVLTICSESFRELRESASFQWECVLIEFNRYVHLLSELLVVSYYTWVVFFLILLFKLIHVQTHHIHYALYVTKLSVSAVNR
jgi:hypothetical protein